MRICIMHTLFEYALINKGKNTPYIQNTVITHHYMFVSIHNRIKFNLYFLCLFLFNSYLTIFLHYTHSNKQIQEIDIDNTNLSQTFLM